MTADEIKAGDSNEISTDNVVYHDVDSYQSLLNIMPAIEKKIN